MTTNQQHGHTATRCIWMEAGVVAYMLCDRNYQCEQCPFDMVMQQRTQGGAAPDADTMTGTTTSGRPSDPEALLSSFFAPLEQSSFPDDRRFASGLVWVQPREHEGTLVGVDALGARLADRISGVVLPQIDTHVVAGEPFAWLLVQDGAIPLLAPLSGIVTQVNNHLIERPALAAEDPYGAGWIAVIHASEIPRLRTSAEQKDRVHALLSELRTHVQRHVHRHLNVSATMFDGGASVGSLAEMLGTKTYLRLISGMFVG